MNYLVVLPCRMEAFLSSRGDMPRKGDWSIQACPAIAVTSIKRHLLG
jgi:hypothetical protein